MPTGRSSAVRSHRRVTPRRKVLPWVIIPLALTLVAGGLTAGYIYFIKDLCSGSVTASVVAPPRTASLLRGLATQWEQTKPQVEGTCAKVDIRDEEADVTAKSLTQEWNGTVTTMPDVWVPQSSAWARATAANSSIADKLMPDRLPSVARTPVVIAMPRALAETYGWPQATLAWRDLLDKLAADGNVKVGISDPATSTAGLLALSSIIDADDNSEVDSEEFKRVYAFQQRIAVYKPTSEELFAEYVSGKGETLTAFPAFEQDILKHNETNASLPLVAVYPTNATTEADYPFLQLASAPWTDAKRQGAAENFLLFVKGDAGRSAVLAEGFRDSNRMAGSQLTPAKGVVSKLSALPRPLLLPEAISRTVRAWNGLTRPSNVLLVLDTSGSMGSIVPGTGQTKLDLTKAAADGAVNFFSDQSSVGLWSFSSADRNAGSPHKELIKTVKLNENNQRAKLKSELAKLVPGGNTGMFDTVWAAHQHLQQNFRADADNLVVVLTDGADDDKVSTTKLADLIGKLKGADPSKPVKVVTIALGRDTDSQALSEISRATGTEPESAARSFDISSVLLEAIFDIK
ncbi:substrate-binding and VWA domain-containing protein [Catelliglobosispora koreensis]|uniref:substrate-binding and VWA domain-containing protein n=1 Tax=Catelliglobosispora koreensis TaxID=129052 RepID=UPI00036332E4|nr:substrate-binding and VWA domain-containing protein [Catelliglobosispora koreensis]